MIFIGIILLRKSNKIIYRWTGTHGTVRVKVNTNKIRAYGGGGQNLILIVKPKWRN